MLKIACVVDAGVKSPENDDCAVVNNRIISQGSYHGTEEEGCFVAVCDGVGGELFGKEAAETVAGVFSRLCTAFPTVDAVNESVKKANDAVTDAQKMSFAHSRMSTTIAGFYINGDDFIAFNVGDSRIYRYRQPYIAQISKDHSMRQAQIDLGCAPKPGQEYVLTRYIGGTHAIPEIVDGTGKVFENDCYILCTDGVWGMLDSDDFEKILGQNDKTENACQALIDLALKKGSTDNLSAIVVRRV